MAITLDIFGHPIYSTTESAKDVITSKYFYEVEFYLLDRTNDIQYNITDSLSLIKFTYDYKNYVFPLMQIKLSLSNNIYKIIRDNDVEIRMSIYKILIHDNSTVSESLSKDIEPFFENKLFTIIDKNKVILNDDDLNDDVPSVEKEFTLFNNEHLKMNKVLFNGNFLNVRLIDVLAMCLNNNLNNDILIEKPNNMNKFNQLIIPPINATRLPNYLQENYAIYDNKIRVLFDYNQTLIMNNIIRKSTPVLTNDYKYVIFDLQTYSDSTNMPNECGYKTSKGGYYYIKTQESNIKISDKSRINQEIFGSRNIVFSKDSDLNTNLNSWNEPSDDKIIDKRQLYYDNFNNPFYLKSDTIENPIKALLKYNNLDVDTFKPNKLFYLKLNDTYYSFRPTFNSFILAKDSNTNIFTCSGVCQFSKNI